MSDRKSAKQAETSTEISYRAKSSEYHFHLVMQDGVPVGYGAHAAAPNGAGRAEPVHTNSRCWV